MPWTLAMLLATAMPASAEGSREYEAALDHVYQLVYGVEYTSDRVHQGVEAFRASLKDDESARNCPAVQVALDEFADKSFRKAIVGYFHSEVFADAVKAAMREHMTLSDMQAYLAFAESPAGRSFLAHQRDSEGDVDAAIDRNWEKSAQFKDLVHEMMVRTAQAEAQCPKPK